MLIIINLLLSLLFILFIDPLVLIHLGNIVYLDFIEEVNNLKSL